MIFITVTPLARLVHSNKSEEYRLNSAYAFAYRYASLSKCITVMPAGKIQSWFEDILSSRTLTGCFPPFIERKFPYDRRSNTTLRVDVAEI